MRESRLHGSVRGAVSNHRPYRESSTDPIITSSVPLPEIALVADEMGIVALQLQAGQYRVHASTDDHRAGEVEIDVPAVPGRVVEIVVHAS